MTSLLVESCAVRCTVTLIAALAIAIPALGAETTTPLPPFYPVSQPPAAYNPDRFVLRKDAAIPLAGENFREKDFVETLSLNGEWKFSGLERAQDPFAAEADLDKGFEQAAFDDSKWEAIPVPSDFYRKAKRQYREEGQKPYVKGWYRKSVAIPATAVGKRVILHFGVVGYEGLLFVNGRKVGSHHGDFTPWTVDITDYVEAGKPAVLALRVLSDLGPHKSCAASGIIKTATHAYGSQYWITNIKGGLWRSVELRIEPSVRIEQVFISPDMESSSIAVSGRIILHGPRDKAVELHGAVLDADTTSPGESPAPSARLATQTLHSGVNTFELKIPLKNPKLWSPQTPNLYHLTLALVEQGKPISVKTERFGFRSFKTEGDHFLLNGKRIYLFGESIVVATTFECGRPEVDQPDANPKARKVAADILLGFRSRGSNTLRLSEQPASSAFLDLADEVGMLIYDMWAWSYNEKLHPSFEKNNLEEVREWIERDYNHPSVVMWLGGNEVRCNEEIAAVFDRQTQLIRSLERSGRPVSAFSGSAYDFPGKNRLDTDLLDLHDYLGLGSKPWTFWEKYFDGLYNSALGVYAKDGKTLGIPYVVWELVGFSWGQRSAPYQPGDVDTYLKWTKGPTSWGAPNGIGWSGSIGLAAALDAKRGGRHGMETVGRRIIDYVRQDTRVAGFAPWFCTDSITLPSTSLWTQPVYCGLRDAAGLPLRNIFGGKTYTQTLFVVDSTNDAYKGATVRVTLREADGTEHLLAEWKPMTLTPWTKISREVSLTIPASPGSRWAQLRVQVFAPGGTVELSRNFYDVFVQNREAVLSPLTSKVPVGILSCGATGTETLRSILKALKVGFTEVSTPEALAPCRVLIVPPSSANPAGLGEGSPLLEPVKEWVRKGGTLLVLEQNWVGEFPLLSRSLRPVPTVFADVVVPAHPALTGLTQANFEFWNNPHYGVTSRHALGPMAADVIVARGPMLQDKESHCVLSDGTYGQGRILASQFDACALWDQDSAASLYLRNVLAAAMTEPPGTIRPWAELLNNYVIPKTAVMVPLDLRAQANMAFKDEVAGDGKGGWTDQGENDFRMMPLGRNFFRGVPFDIIDPASNGGKSCIVVRDRPTGSFIAAANGIKVAQRLSRLFFLHTEAYTEANEETLLYRVTYADGQKLDIPTKDNVTIADWWSCHELTGAKLAFTRANTKSQEVGLFIMEWKNPRPDVEIQTLDIVAPAGRKTISMVVAITAEK